MNDIARFLADHTKDIPRELAEDYYQYCKSTLAPEPNTIVILDHLNLIDTKNNGQDNIGE